MVNTLMEALVVTRSGGLDIPAQGFNPGWVMTRREAPACPP